MEREEFAAWLRLLETPGLGRTALRRLLQAFGSPQEVLQAAPSARRDVARSTAVAALLEEPAHYSARLEAAWQWLQGGEGRHVVALGDAAYPQALLESPDPPLLFYAHGALSRLAAPRMLAMVGSRHPTAQGLDHARQFASFLGRQGFTIVSGLAVGVDAASHEGALDTPAGTIAVVGQGLDSVYPRQNAGLARRIVDGGSLILSEYAPGTPPLREHFPARNRIIAGLSQGTLVVEAALQSGSLITARLAAEAGREVFAIPGSIHATQARGCHALIKQGAKLVEVAQDVLEELGAWPAALGADATEAHDASDDAEETDPLLRALGHDPMDLDTLSARTGLDVATLGARLLELELQGALARLPGGLYQRRQSA